jgi:hypothetical protein
LGLQWVAAGMLSSARHYCYCHIIHLNIEIKAEAGDLQQAQRFAMHGSSFIPQ